MNSNTVVKLAVAALLTLPVVSFADVQTIDVGDATDQLTSVTGTIIQIGSALFGMSAVAVCEPPGSCAAVASETAHCRRRT